MENAGSKNAGFRNMKIDELIKLRYCLMERLRVVEQRDDFGSWKLVIVDDPCESYPDLRYTHDSNELSEVVEAIGVKWLNLVCFTTDEFGAAKNRYTCLYVLREIKKKPQITRKELVEKVQGDVDGALDYLIENNNITYKITSKYAFWKVLNDQI